MGLHGGHTRAQPGAQEGRDRRRLGYNYFGQTNVPSGLTNVIAVAAGLDSSLALKSDGTVAAWGGNGSGQTNVPAGLTNVSMVAAGGTHSLALKSDGTVVGWGDNSEAQTSVPAGLGNAVLVLAGGSANFSNSRYRSYSLAIPVQLKLAAFRLTNNVPVLTFRTFSSQQYLVQRSSDLGSNSWIDLPGGAISGNGSDAAVSDSTGGGSTTRFYRIKQ